MVSFVNVLSLAEIYSYEVGILIQQTGFPWLHSRGYKLVLKLVWETGGQTHFIYLYHAKTMVTKMLTEYCNFNFNILFHPIFYF